MFGVRLYWNILVMVVLVVVVCVWSVAGLAAGTPIKTDRPPLLYILMDGLRWDYVEQQDESVLPGFNRIMKEGVRARWMNPLFPSVSYPTWTTLGTGLYPESHNIIENDFYDAKTGEYFSLGDPETTGNPKWWTSEQIWTTAEKAGLRTAQFLWSRCDVPFDGVVTEFCEKYVSIPGKEIFQTNIQRALSKLDEGFDFVQVYTEEPDGVGHTYGPDSEEVKQAMRDLDDVLMQLLNGLEQRGILDKVNIVIVSDHGMTTTIPSVTKFHEIDDYLDINLVEKLTGRGGVTNIKVKNGKVEEVYSQVSGIPGVRAFKHDDIPARYHYQSSPYIHDIIVVADMGHYIMGSHSDKQIPPRGSQSVNPGNHGYDPDEREMKASFMVRGPAFKCGSTVEWIDVVDVYQVLTQVLGVTPLPHNGTWSHVEPIFRTSADSHCSSSPVTSSPFMFLTLLAFVISQIFNYFTLTRNY